MTAFFLRICIISVDERDKLKMNATFVGMNKALIPAYLLTFVNVLGFSILMPVLPFIVEAYEAPKWVYGLLLTL